MSWTKRRPSFVKMLLSEYLGTFYNLGVHHNPEIHPTNFFWFKVFWISTIAIFKTSCPFRDLQYNDTCSKVTGPGQNDSAAACPGISSCEGAEEGHRGLRIAVASWWGGHFEMDSGTPLSLETLERSA